MCGWELGTTDSAGRFGEALGAPGRWRGGAGRGIRRRRRSRGSRTLKPPRNQKAQRPRRRTKLFRIGFVDSRFSVWPPHSARAGAPGSWNCPKHREHQVSPGRPRPVGCERWCQGPPFLSRPFHLSYVPPRHSKLQAEDRLSSAVPSPIPNPPNPARRHRVRRIRGRFCWSMERFDAVGDQGRAAFLKEEKWRSARVVRRAAGRCGRDSRCAASPCEGHN